MSKSIRTTTTVDGNTVTLNVDGAMSPPPVRVAVSRRGAVVTIKKGAVDITIDIPADATKKVTIKGRGRVVCSAQGRPMTDSPPPPGGGKKMKKAKKSKKTIKRKAMTDPPPPPPKSKAMTDPPPPPPKDKGA